MSFITRVLPVLLIGASGAMLAAESGPTNGAIEISAGETVYFQLLDSTPNKVGSAIRVENPNRDSLVVKATFETGNAGAKILRIRNGYDGALMFAWNTACPPQNTPGLLPNIRPGVEVSLPISVATTKIVLCNFRILTN